MRRLKFLNSLRYVLLIGFFWSLVSIANGLNTAPQLEVGVAKIRAGALIIDARSAGDFAVEHIDGAINIPHDQLAGRLDELAIDKDASIVTYCRSGRRAGVAAQILLENGYTDVINGGGLEALKKSL